jgi:hypothetical protein
MEVDARNEIGSWGGREFVWIKVRLRGVMLFVWLSGIEDLKLFLRLLRGFVDFEIF